MAFKFVPTRTVVSGKAVTPFRGTGNFIRQIPFHFGNGLFGSLNVRKAPKEAVRMTPNARILSSLRT
jgi:hypothetical protein